MSKYARIQNEKVKKVKKGHQIVVCRTRRSKNVRFVNEKAKKKEKKVIRYCVQDNSIKITELRMKKQKNKKGYQILVCRTRGSKNARFANEKAKNVIRFLCAGQEGLKLPEMRMKK